MIRKCEPSDLHSVLAIINDGASAYKGVIPPDRFREPYMSEEELRHEIAAGVIFWGYEVAGRLSGVMGIQPVADVVLIRHAYVRTDSQKQGIGSKLLAHLRTLESNPVLIGTWADAVWAIRFYERHGFHTVDTDLKEKTPEEILDRARSADRNLRCAGRQAMGGSFFISALRRSWRLFEQQV